MKKIGLLLLIVTMVLAAMVPMAAFAADGVKVQFFNGNTASSTNTLYVNFKLANTGTTALTLSTVKMRYYFTNDGTQGDSFACDYSTLGAANVTGTFGTVSATNADRYLEVGFGSGAGTLAAGANLEVKARVWKSDWSNFTQTNDYSFNATATNYVDSTVVTAYLSGTLVWGAEAGSSATATPVTATATPIPSTATSTPTPSTATSTPTPTPTPGTATPTPTPYVTAKVMPLGDSITDGITVAGAYRTKLWKDITGNGLAVDFVGSLSGGPSDLGDKNHEGHSGWRIDQIDANINTWMDTYKPKIVLLHIGTNDINQNYNVANAPTRLSALIDKICAKLPAGGKLYVAKIIPESNYNLNQGVINYNNQIPGIVQNKVSQGKPVYMVDMYSALTAADLADGIHPNATGYGKMGDVWFNAIKNDLK